VHSGRRKLEPPLCVRRASGAYVEDVDGNRFIDYHAAYGAILLGHSYPAVVQRVVESVQRRVLFAVGTTESEAALAEKLVTHIPSVERAVEDNSGQVAGIIVEPIMHNSMTIAPRGGFLEGLRELCDREGIVLVFDEVITGFRHDLGGFQKLCGVTPDLTCMGKALGNGFPIAALGGRRDLMERFTTTDDGDVWYGGSYNGNEAGVSAALANLEGLEGEGVHEPTARDRDRMGA